jgi:hypothetical protein
MADTIITNTPDRGATEDNSALGLVLALIVVAVVVIGGIYLYRHGSIGVPNTGGTNINVTVPGTGSDSGGGGAPSGGSGGDTGGSTGGSTQ